MSFRHLLGFDIGSNSVGSVWIDRQNGRLTPGTSIFPAGVDESDDKRGEPKNAKRRMTRRTRITLRRRSERKRDLRLRLIAAGLLPAAAEAFRLLLEQTDPWALRREGLDKALTPHQFGRVLLHLAQRRGALGLKMADADDREQSVDAGEDGKVKAAIGEIRSKMLAANSRTFGEFVAGVRDERVFPLSAEDNRSTSALKGPREYRDAIRNRRGNYEHCADRAMIREEFRLLWETQKRLGGPLAAILTDDLRGALDDESGDNIWRHKGLLFGQRRQSWDLGTLGRCVLHPEERCVPHADMHASRYRVVETVNNLRIIERGVSRPLTKEERARIKGYLGGPLGVHSKGKAKGKPKTTVSINDLRGKMAEWYGKDKWTHTKKRSPCRFKSEDADEDKDINTDWFRREIVHGAVGVDAWENIPELVRGEINKAILKHDPAEEEDADQLRAGMMKWAGLDTGQADALVAAWRGQPSTSAKRLSMSRRAVRNLLTVMDRDEPWPDAKSADAPPRWLTQVEARRLLAGDADFKDVTTGKPMDEVTRRRYATGAKGATAKDRYYMRKHVLMRNGKPIIGDDGRPLAEPPPAPLISNPVVRKAIHEVRRHLVEYMTTFGRKPDAIFIELAREARMGAKDSDRALFRNRLRDRIRKEIASEFGLDSGTPTQKRAALDRVVLCVQQGGVCPLCGKGGLTHRNAANGTNCEVAHIIPRAVGGHNGLGNLVLAHTKCNRDMARRTPRQFWNDALPGGFDEGFRWVEGIFTSVERPKPSEMKKATGEPLWSCYFDSREDARKIEQFAKDLKDIQEMADRQKSATQYATRQVMAYLSDAVFDGKGLPERSSGTGDDERERRIFSSDGLWTSRLRREWGLFFDPHEARAKGLGQAEEHQRREKNRGDHRHHAIDAVVVALCDRSLQIAWEEREKSADAAGINTADEEQMENYRRQHPLDPPRPFKTREEFREAVKLAVFGDEENPRPICHRPVKRKLIGALHEETLLGPALDRAGQLTDNFTAKKSVLELKPNHLRMPEGWDELEAELHNSRVTQERKGQVLSQLAAMEDPPPAKSGIVRDRALRSRLRACLRGAGVDSDDFTLNDIKKLAESGRLRHASGVPIRTVVLLRTMRDPVLISRRRQDYVSGSMERDADLASTRAYVGGNNHHIEVRAARNKQGHEVFTGKIVTAFEAARRKLEKLNAFRAASIPRPAVVRALSQQERAGLRPIIAAIEKAHPIVNRADDDTHGGRFIMSLCEGETVFTLHKQTRQPGYFVVAKLDKPQSIVLVPHWDARSAGERKDSNGKPIPDSGREQFSVTPSDLVALAPPGHAHAVKVRVSPLGVVTILQRD